jgi:predicted DNA binding protein/GAF domain-containing protein
VSRVLLFTEPGENRRLLAEWLGTDYEVLTGDAPAALDREFDCCLVDRAMLGRHESALAERKRRERPVVLPYLFVISQRELDRLGPERWRRIDAVVRERVDELITAPIKKAELKARLDNLLNSRALSVELRDQRDALRTLDRLNAVIRSIDRSLVRASTREEIEQAVCDRLVEVDRYAAAWVGTDSATSRRVTPRASAGPVDGYLDAVDVVAGPDATEPAALTVATGKYAVVDDAGDGAERWRAAAADYGFGSAVAVPVVYEDTRYGVLAIYADRPGAFAEADEVAVLRELGGTIGHAITAAESKRALLTDRIAELEVEVDAPGTALAGISERVAAPLAFVGMVTTADGAYLEYYAVEVDDPERVLAAADDDGVARLRHVGNHGGEALFEVRLTDGQVVQTVGALGGRTTDCTVSHGRYRLTAAFPHDVDRRAIVEALDEKYGAATLRAKRETERDRTTRQELWTSFRDRLTDQQWSALQAAYYAGFFEWPRASTGEEVAASLDISAPTFHEHLRAAQNKLLETLLVE